MRWTRSPLAACFVAAQLACPAVLAQAETQREPQAPAPVVQQDDMPPQIAAAAATEPDGVPWRFTTSGKIVAVSMSQGFTGRLVKLLQQVEVIDQNEDWVAGDTHLVYLGNLFGYGDSNIEGLELLHKLHGQAEAAGGKVHMLLGSTDFANLRGMLSTMPSRAYEALATDESQARLDQELGESLEELWAYNEDKTPDIRKSLRTNYENFFRRAHHPGAMEFMDLYAPGTEIGEWFRQINTILSINDILFVAGGLHPMYATVPIDRLNAYHRNEYNSTSIFVPAMADVKTGPYVWRGLSFPKMETDRIDVNKMLGELGFRLMVVGHSPSPYGECMLKGRVLHVDSNFMALRDQAAYNAIVFEGDSYIMNNAGRERRLRVPAVPGQDRD